MSDREKPQVHLDPDATDPLGDDPVGDPDLEAPAQEDDDQD